MKPTNVKIICVVLFLSFTGIQSTFSQSVVEKPSLEKSNIEGKFNYIYQQSGDFEDFKMVKKWWLTRLKTHVLDSIKFVEGQLIASQKLVEIKQTSIDSLNSLLLSNNSALSKTIKEKNSLRFLGIPMDKAAYNSMVWIIIAGLSLTLALFILLYKRSSLVTKQIKNDLTEIRTEFESFRKRALEREEGIVRKYHNELMQYKTKAGKV
jgi:hypothetical protein